MDYSNHSAAEPSNMLLMRPSERIRCTVDHGSDGRGLSKIPRTEDSYSTRSHLSVNNGSGSLSSLLSPHDSLTGCSPTASEGTLTGGGNNNTNNSSNNNNNNNNNNNVETRMICSPQLSSCYNQQPQLSFRSAAGFPFSMSRDTLNLIGLHDRMGMGLNQRREYELQLIIFRYIVNGLNVPTELLLAFRNTLVGLDGIPTAPHYLTTAGWGNYHFGFQNSSDPEPHRCRRTDGKKWRCSRDVVPDQKYCERHMHRGKNRRKALLEGNNNSNQPVSATTLSTITSTNNYTGTGSAGNSTALVSKLQEEQQQQQQPQHQRSNSGFCVNSTNNGSDINIVSSRNPSPFHYSSSSANRDYQYLNGISKSEMDLGAEHMFFAEASGSTRDDSQHVNSLYHAATWSPPKESGTQAQALRHFFDDWPRSTRENSSSLTWASMDDEKCNSGSTSVAAATPQLSIAASLNKPSPSPILKLSMTSDDSTRMGMGLGLISEDSEEHYRHHQQQAGSHNSNISHSNSASRAWAMVQMTGCNGSPVGGPLAEALHAKTGNNDHQSNGPLINIMTSSPTGVLQINNHTSSNTFGSFSDSSSGRSSPRTASTILPGLL